MGAISIATFVIGLVAGFTLARRLMLRTLALLICATTALIVFAISTPTKALPGEGTAILLAAFLIAPPLASGLFGGGVLAWLLRSRGDPS